MAFLLGVHYEADLEQQPDSFDSNENNFTWWRHPEQPLSLQLHSEYRSTYQWHQVATTINNPTAGAASGRPQVQKNEVVRRPPKPITGK
jgi:hypothetical protein